MRRWIMLGIGLWYSLAVSLACAGEKDVVLLTTTSFVDTGLGDELKVKFEESSGYRLKIVSTGTGQALRMAERGEGDVVLAHAPALEEEMVRRGIVIERHRVMHNDFVIVGPQHDPAEVRGVKKIEEVMRRIATQGVPFVSRGDNSGTHEREKHLWKIAGVRPNERYIESGTGMGKTLLIASEKQAYTLSDRATFLAFKDKVSLVPLFEGDPELFNIYHIMVVNPTVHPVVNREGALKFVAFMLSQPIQRFIGDYKRELYGQPLFVPDALGQQ